MKSSYPILCLLLICILGNVKVSSSQNITRSVISSGGKYAFNSSGSIEYNVGEVLSNTLVNPGYITTQGFVQPDDALVSAVLGNDKNDILLFPNPTANFVFITSGKGYKLLSIEIYDIQGRQIKSAETLNRSSDNSYSLNISFLNNGVYFIRIIDEIASSYIGMMRVVKI